MKNDEDLNSDLIIKKSYMHSMPKILENSGKRGANPGLERIFVYRSFNNSSNKE